jgi:hypothetical protein
MTGVSQIPIIPPPPRAPAAFSEGWANELNRWLNNLSQRQIDFVYARLNGLFYPGIPTTGYGLVAGEVFSNGGVLTIVRENAIWMGPLSAAGAVGSLTVSV